MPKLLDRRLVDRQRPARAKPPRDLHGLEPAADKERPRIAVARRRADKALVPGKIPGYLRSPMLGEIIRCREDNATKIGQPPGFEARIGKLADPNGEIEASADAIDITVGHIEIDIDLGMRPQKCADRRHDVKRREYR